MSLAQVNISQWEYSVLAIETKSVCNMLCKYCMYPYRPDRGITLPEKNVFEIIDSLIIDGTFKYICFSCINETLLDERIYRFIQYAKNRNLPVLILTNGLLFNSRDVIYKLIDSAPAYIKVSLQTVNPAIFQSARGITSSFDEYKNGIFEFLRAVLGKPSRVTVDVACNLLSGIRNLKTKLFGLERGDPSVYNTIDDLKSDVKFFLNELKDLDKRFVFNGDIDTYLNRANLSYSENAGFNISDNIIFKIKPFIYWKKLFEFYPIKGGVGCRDEVLAILASGNVVPCCLAYGDFMKMGNIKKESLKMILEKNIQKLNNIRRGIDLTLCCRRCLGAPTKRGALFRRLKHVTIRKINNSIKKT